MVKASTVGNKEIALATLTYVASFAVLGFALYSKVFL